MYGNYYPYSDKNKEATSITGKRLWSGPDSEENWNKLLKSNSKLLDKKTEIGSPEQVALHSSINYYKQFPIEYSHNKAGFRMDNNITSNPCFIYLGCSHTYGVGLHLKDTWVYKVHKHIGKGYEMYNFGLPGGSMAASYRLLQAYILATTPKKVFLYHPHHFRTEFYNDRLDMFDQLQFAKIKEDDHPFSDVPPEVLLMILNSNSMYLSYLAYTQAIAFLCHSNNIEFYFCDEAKPVPIDPNYHKYIKDLEIDRLARDMAHPSYNSQNIIANIFIGKYKNKDTAGDKNGLIKISRENY